MSKIDPLAKMLGEGLVEMRRKLDAAEGRADELQRKLNVAHQALRGAREAFEEVEAALDPPRKVVPGLLAPKSNALSKMLDGPDASDVREALLIIRETLTALEVAP
jgi:hypothetical protein